MPIQIFALTADQSPNPTLKLKHDARNSSAALPHPPPLLPMTSAAASPRTLYVEYCTNCGFASMFSELKAAMKREMPEVAVIGNRQPPRMSQMAAEQAEQSSRESPLASFAVLSR